MPVTYNDIQKAAQRISDAIHTTPIVSSRLLNQWLGHDIMFKAECLQKTGAFKIRGATNFIRKYLEQSRRLPTKIIANSSGNHAQAVACAGSREGIPVQIYAAENISPVKAAATRHYGAELSLFSTRVDADQAIKQTASDNPDFLWIPPYNHPDIIAGQGTVTAEAIQACEQVDAVFVPCGGGGLSSGALIATRHLNPKAKVIAAEPLAANDAAQSLRNGYIVGLDKTPDTLADGAATPCVGEFTFEYLQQLDDLVEVSESDIVYWTQWLQHLLKLHIEPTCAMTMQAVIEWLRKQTSKKQVLVIISGGNISAHSMQKIWQYDRLNQLPRL